MKIPDCPFTVLDWSKLPITTYPGDSGVAGWKTDEVGDLRVRVVKYSPNYIADHWCDRGHVLYVLEGELCVELKDGRKIDLTAGMSFTVSDFGDAAHRPTTTIGAQVLIVD